MKLDDTQQILWRLITAREGAAGADALVCGDDRLGAAERVDVYANMYFFRLLECLSEDFPALHAVVGHEGFHRLAADYLEAHPSRHPSVRMLGRELGDFLERHVLSGSRAWLPDLARFEWALLEAFDAPDAPPVDGERLGAVAPEIWGDLRFTLTPSLRVLVAGAPIDEVWKAATSKQEIPPVESAMTALRVWREGLVVFHRRLEPVELAALQAVARGERFSDVCQAAATIVGDADAATEVVRVLRRWIGDGMIVEIEASPSA